jgi:alanyl-tRNA synthetase
MLLIPLTRHGMDEEHFKKLTKAFANTFLHVFQKLETIRKQLKNEIHEEERQFSKWKKELMFKIQNAVG